MNLGDLISELRENILYDRSDRVAGTSDYLWSDATLARYINEAQNRFCRQGLILRDGTTPEVTQITLQEGVSHYSLHPSVLAVISAKHGSDVADLARAGHAAFDTYRQPDPYYFDPSSLSTLSPGKPLAYSTDDYLSVSDCSDALNKATLRVYPQPTAQYAGDIIHLRVVRLPLYPLTITNLRGTPEVPEIHQLDMLDWAAYLALRIVDVDAGYDSRADKFRASFEAHAREARQVAMRKMFAPLQWGFGRNGFSWER